jgi:hypothetical protein
LAEIGLNLVVFFVDDNNIPKILLFFQAICCWRCNIPRFCGSEARCRQYSDKGMVPWHGVESVARLTVQAAGAWAVPFAESMGSAGCSIVRHIG